MANINGSKVKFTERKLHIEQLRFSADHNARAGDEPKAAGKREEDDGGEEGLHGGLPMPMLMASIEAVGGIILPLIVVDLGQEDEQGRALYSVAAGKRRTTALLALWKAGRLSDPVVSCREVEKVDPMMISLIENMAREPMHPADECVAFGKLVEGGESVEQVASAFAVDVRHVQQRLALAKLHPTLLAEFRARKFSLDVAKALTLEPDSARQLAVWKKLPAYQRSAYSVRQALTAEDVRSGDRLVRFVGLEAYKQAGGEVREDLFDTSGDNLILTDPGLLETLAAAKLQDRAASLVQQGWAWAEVVTHSYSYDVSRHATSQGLVLIGATGADRSKAGYFVYCDGLGSMKVEGPFASRKDVRAAKGQGQGDAGEDSPAKVSESLLTSLTAHKTAALQCALLGNQRVTLALLAANAVSLRYERRGLEVRFDSQGGHIERTARGYEGTRAATVLAEADKGWEGRIPEDADAFAWFLEQPESVALEAIVWATARSFTMVNGRIGTPDGVDKLQDALSFNLAEYFRPTVDTYLGQVPKAKIISDVTDALGAEAAAPLAGLKKDELAAAAAAKLADVAWVPDAIR
jgi:ParB-like chromosome segregation protein Spo0J